MFLTHELRSEAWHEVTYYELRIIFTLVLDVHSYLAPRLCYFSLIILCGVFAAIPSLLVAMGFMIAPLLVFDALDHKTSYWFIIGYFVAVLSDIFDGIISRRLKVSTSQGKRI